MVVGIIDATETGYMRETLQRLIKLIVGYGAVQWAGPLVSLIFTPIITRFLLPDDYGVADYLLTITSALSTLALIALPQAITTHFNDRPEDLPWQRTVTGSGFVIALISGVGFGFALFLCAPILTARVPIISEYTNLVRLIGLAFGFGVMVSVLTSTAQAALRVRWGMVFSLVSIGFTVIGNLLFIVILRLGVTGMILTPIVTGFAVWIATLTLMRSMIGRPSLDVVKMLLRSGGLLLPTMMAGWILQVSDRLILGQFVSATALGHYAIANRMASLVYVAMAPIYAAWTPLALASQHQEQAMERYINISRYLIVAVLLIGLGIGLFATEILIVLTRPNYLPAAPYVGFLAYMHVFSGFGTILYTGALMGKKLGSVSITVVIGALINIGLNLLLIPSYGVWGATIATMVGYGVPQVVLYQWLQRRYPIPYPMGHFMAALGVQFALQVISLLVPALVFPLRIAIKLAIFAILPFSFIVLGMITKFELIQAYLFTRNQLRLGWARLHS
jgi:O-antigen/teichoic acid export membrane protein